MSCQEHIVNMMCAMEVCHYYYPVCACTHVYCGLSVALDYSMLLNLAYGEFSTNRCSPCWSAVILFICFFRFISLVLVGNKRHIFAYISLDAEAFSGLLCEYRDIFLLSWSTIMNCMRIDGPNHHWVHCCFQ